MKKIIITALVIFNGIAYAGMSNLEIGTSIVLSNCVKLT